MSSDLAKLAPHLVVALRQVAEVDAEVIRLGDRLLVERDTAERRCLLAEQEAVLRMRGSILNLLEAARATWPEEARSLDTWRRGHDL